MASTGSSSGMSSISLALQAATIVSNDSTSMTAGKGSFERSTAVEPVDWPVKVDMAPCRRRAVGGATGRCCQRPSHNIERDVRRCVTSAGLCDVPKEHVQQGFLICLAVAEQLALRIIDFRAVLGDSIAKAVMVHGGKALGAAGE